MKYLEVIRDSFVIANRDADRSSNDRSPAFFCIVKPSGCAGKRPKITDDSRD